MRESKELYATQALHTTKQLGRLAIAIMLALPLNFAAARPKQVFVADTAPAVSQASDAQATARHPHPAYLPLAADILFAKPAVVGPAIVIDGDTLDVAGERVRLEGIDAPETSQTCRRHDGRSWRCGRAATRALRKMIDGRRVRCQARGRGTYGRILGRCFVGNEEINALMVRRGFAWAFVKYSKNYIHLEASARRLKVGIWQGPAQPAWDYRANRWALAEGDAPEGCAIKGNITRRGKIYHMPWGSWYGRVRIETAKGERWFCSEAEAVGAGWRAVAKRSARRAR